MLILLPPSQGKTAPDCGSALKLDALVCPSLTPVRADTAAALVALCRDEPDRAAHILGLGPRQAGEVTANAALFDSPAAPASAVYTGVLFAALGLSSMPAADYAFADEHLLIASALFGFVAPSDRIPHYRLAAGITLPGLAAPRRVWGSALRDALAEIPDPGPVLDLRSGAYAALYRPRPDAGGELRDGAGREWLVPHVLLERNGRRSVVSHHNKAAKGRLVRDLVRCRPDIRAGSDLADTLAGLGWRIERAGASFHVVLDEL